MIRELTCIGCPMGCQLTVTVVDGKASDVSGNTCGIGRKYAEQEVSAPTRMVTSTVLSGEGVPVPVKTREPVPKSLIFDVMAAIKSAEISLPAYIGDILIEDVCGTGVPVVITGNIDTDVRSGQKTVQG